MDRRDAVNRIGSALRKLRERAGMSQAIASDRVAAAGVAISPPEISKIESGRREVGAGLLYAYLQAMGWSLLDLHESLDAGPVGHEAAELRRDVAHSAASSAALLELESRIDLRLRALEERVDVARKN